MGFGGPGRDRTDDLFHAMEARSQLRHRPTFGGRLSAEFGEPKNIVADIFYCVNATILYSFPQAGLS